MRRLKKNNKKINSKVLFVVFFITMFLFGTSYAILTQELTLTGTVTMKIEDEGTELTITDFNTSINPIYTQYLFNIIPISGYKVVGITIQNNLSRTINNWTVEFTSSRTAETNKPTNNQLSAYLGAEYGYDSVTNSNGTVIVTGSDTLAPGATKTVYVFFSCNLLNNNITFGNERAYYTPNRSRTMNSKSSNMLKKDTCTKYDINETKEFAILICYDTTVVADNLYNTVMYIFIGNNTGKNVSDIKFDVKYKNSNLSNLLSSSINIVTNNDSGASFISNDVINNLSYKGYIVTGLKTYGGFDGMDITNISYSLSDGSSVVEEPTNTNTNNNTTNNDNIILENDFVNSMSDKNDNKNDNTITNTITNTIINDILNNDNNIENMVIDNSSVEDETSEEKIDKTENNIVENNVDEKDISENNKEENNK